METLLSSGTSATASDAQVVAADTAVTVVATGNGYIYIDVQGVGGAWANSATLSRYEPNKGSAQVSGPCTFRVRRPLQSSAVAVGLEEG